MLLQSMGGFKGGFNKCMKESFINAQGQRVSACLVLEGNNKEGKEESCLSVLLVGFPGASDWMLYEP